MSPNYNRGQYEKNEKTIECKEYFNQTENVPRCIFNCIRRRRRASTGAGYVPLCQISRQFNQKINTEKLLVGKTAYSVSVYQLTIKNKIFKEPEMLLQIFRCKYLITLDFLSSAIALHVQLWNFSAQDFWVQ